MRLSESLGVLSSSGLSDEGYEKKKNEDAWDIFKIEGVFGTITIAIVADGVTSKTGGATASSLAVLTIRQFLNQVAASISDATTLQTIIDKAIRHANQVILDEARKNPELGNMSTTLVLAAVGWGELQLAYLGDSRAYLLRNGQLHRLTLDHSWTQEALDKGLICQEDLNRHPNRNVIRRFLGINRQLDIDRKILEPGHYQRNYLERSYTQSLILIEDDQLLLCSDGLTERTTDDEIASTLVRRASQTQRSVNDLIQLALARKEPDNVTAVVLSLAKEKRHFAFIKHMARAAVVAAIFVAMIASYILSKHSSFPLPAINAPSTPLEMVTEATVSSGGNENAKSASAAVANNSGGDISVQHGEETKRIGQKKMENDKHDDEVSNPKEGSQQELEEQVAQLITTLTPVPLGTTTAIPTASPQTTSKTPAATPTRTRAATATPTKTQTPTAPSIQQSTPQPTEGSTQRSRSTPQLVKAVIQFAASLNQPTGPSQEASISEVALQGVAGAISTKTTESAPISSTRSIILTEIQSEAQSTPTRKTPPTRAGPNTTPAARATTLESSSSLTELVTVESEQPVDSQTLPEVNSPNLATDAPLNSSKNDSAQEEFSLLLPPNQETLRVDFPVAFQWRTDFPLGENQTFEVVAWQPKNGKGAAMEQGMGMVDIRYSPPIQIDEMTWVLRTSPPNNFEAGEYEWAILIVETEPAYKRIQMLGNATRTFMLNKQSSGNRSGRDSGGSQSGNCSGASCDDR